MAIYNTLTSTFVTKYFSLLSKHGRSIDQKYSDKCGKEIFVARTMNKWLKNKYFAVIYKDDTGIVSYSDEKNFNSYYKVKLDRKHFIKISSCEFALGYGNDIKIYVDDIFSATIYNNVIFGRENFLHLQFYEITQNEYTLINNLFTDDREEIEFELSGYAKKPIVGKKTLQLQEIKVKVMAKDYGAAKKKAIDRYKEYIIYD